MQVNVFLKCYRCGFRSKLRAFSDAALADVLLLRDAGDSQMDHCFGIETCGSRERIGQLATYLTARPHRHKSKFCHRAASPSTAPEAIFVSFLLLA
jgi:hypothetical protein